MYFFSTLKSHTNWVRSVAYSPDNLRIVSSSDDDSIKIWDAHSYQLLNTLNGHTNMVNSVVFSPNNLSIASGSCDNTIIIWDAHSGQLLNTLKKMKTSFHFFEKIFNTHCIVSIKYFDWSY